ncbi:MAG: hypothetical protein ACTSU5_12210 [Promethearchaeota archaeon]
MGFDDQQGSPEESGDRASTSAGEEDNSADPSSDVLDADQVAGSGSAGEGAGGEEGLLKEDGWYKIGFHRPIAGFWFNYLPFIVGAVVALVVVGTIFPLILPFPDAKGYQGIATSMYALMFLLFDAGIGSAIGRFVPEYRIKDPQRALQFISFFIWFQMFTGLVQVTVIAVYVFKYLPASMGHLAWIFLIYSTIQYPGQLGIFYSVLKSFQHFSKVGLISFIQDTIVQTTTEVVMILLGRWWGMNNPAIGEMMGLSIGLVLGMYLDDFIGFGIGAKLFDNVLKDIGFRVGDCLRPNFSKVVAKEAMIFGLKTMPSSLYGTALGFFSFLITFANLPAYAAWIGMIELGRGITRLVGIAGPIAGSVEHSIAESYNNDRYNLTHYYIALSLKWRYFITLMFGGTIVILVPLLMVNMLDVFGKNWLPVIGLIPILAIPEFINMFNKPISFTKVDRPLVDQAFGIASSTASFLWYVVLIYGLRVELNVYILVLKDIPLTITFMALNWLYLHKKILKIRLRDFVTQVFLVPVPATLLYVLFCYGYAALVFPIGAALMSPIGFAVLTLLLALFFWPALIMCPLLALFGGWDEYTLQSFKDCVDLTGPSKFLVKMMVATTSFFHRISPLGGRFPIKGGDLAAKEALELVDIKRVKDIENIKMKMEAGD